MLRTVSKITVSLAALAMMQAATSAHATEAAAATATAEAAEADSADAADAGSDNAGLTEIVVTATRRETNLQDTPISIAVMGNEEIKKRHVTSLLDLADGGVPSLRVATYESRQSALTIGIRGIVPGDANQPAREQGVGVYIDGVYLGRQHGLNTALLDIERIEVLKGPQGTLFGRNTEGGALNVVSKAPTGEFGGRASVGMGNFGSYNGAIHLDLPKVANIAFKIDAVIDHQGATVKNPLRGQTGWNFHHRYGGRLSARWTPSPDFTADIAIDAANDENTPFYSQLLNYNPAGYTVATLAEIQANANKLPAGKIAPLPALVRFGTQRMKTADIGVVQEPSVDKTRGVMAMLKWKADDSLELRSITARRTVDAEQWDNSGGAHRTPTFLPNGNFARYSLSFLEARQFSQEFQAVGSLPNLDYVLGLYYFNERAGEVAATPNTNKWNADGTSYTINDARTWEPANWSISRATRARSKSYAAYGQVTWTPAGLDSLHLTVGGRYTHDKKSGSLYKLNNAVVNFPFAISGSRFDPLVTLAWDAAQDVNVYAKFATGYRAGGASSRSVTFAAFGPESVKSYELGIKTDLLDRRVRLNVAAYMMDRKNSQFDFDFYIPQSNGTIRHTLETVNAAGVTKIRGLEADLTVRPMDGLSMGLSYAYTHWKVPATPNPLVAGNPLQPLFIVYTPPHALSGSIDYELPLGGAGAALKLHMDGNYSARQYTFDNEPVKAESSFLVNARLAVTDIPMGDGGQKLAVAAWARNLFNEAHIYRRSNANRVPIDGNYGAVIGDYGNFNTPRTFGIDATVSF